jgi:hypothetical protein
MTKLSDGGPDDIYKLIDEFEKEFNKSQDDSTQGSSGNITLPLMKRQTCYSHITTRTLVNKYGYGYIYSDDDKEQKFQEFINNKNITNEYINKLYKSTQIYLYINDIKNEFISISFSFTPHMYILDIKNAIYNLYIDNNNNRDFFNKLGNTDKLTTDNLDLFLNNINLKDNSTLFDNKFSGIVELTLKLKPALNK